MTDTPRLDYPNLREAAHLLDMRESFVRLAGTPAWRREFDLACERLADAAAAVLRGEESGL